MDAPHDAGYPRAAGADVIRQVRVSDVRGWETSEAERKRWRSAWLFCASQRARASSWFYASAKAALRRVLFPVVIAAAINAAMAQGTSVPHKLAPCPWDGPTARCTGPAIYMDSIVRYLVNGIRYDIPAAYLTDWPKAEVLATIQANDRGGLPDFAFWMPSKRPELIKTGPPMVLPELRRRGSTWGPDEYPVVVLHPRFVKPNDPDLILPEQKFRNASGALSGPGDVFIDKYGLQEFVLDKDRVRSKSFRNVPGTNPQFLFHCYQGPFSTCSGDVYFQQDELSFRVWFPLERIQNWTEILTGVHDLIFSWRNLTQKS